MGSRHQSRRRLSALCTALVLLVALTATTSRAQDCHSSTTPPADDPTAVADPRFACVERSTLSCPGFPTTSTCPWPPSDGNSDGEPDCQSRWTYVYATPEEGRLCNGESRGLTCIVPPCTTAAQRFNKTELCTYTCPEYDEPTVQPTPEPSAAPTNAPTPPWFAPLPLRVRTRSFLPVRGAALLDRHVYGGYFSVEFDEELYVLESRIECQIERGWLDEAERCSSNNNGTNCDRPGTPDYVGPRNVTIDSSFLPELADCADDDVMQPREFTCDSLDGSAGALLPEVWWDTEPSRVERAPPGPGGVALPVQSAALERAWRHFKGNRTVCFDVRNLCYVKRFEWLDRGHLGLHTRIVRPDGLGPAWVESGIDWDAETTRYDRYTVCPYYMELAARAHGLHGVTYDSKGRHAARFNSIAQNGRNGAVEVDEFLFSVRYLEDKTWPTIDVDYQRRTFSRCTEGLDAFNETFACPTLGIAQIVQGVVSQDADRKLYFATPPQQCPQTLSIYVRTVTSFAFDWYLARNDTVYDAMREACEVPGDTDAVAERCIDPITQEPARCPFTRVVHPEGDRDADCYQRPMARHNNFDYAGAGIKWAKIVLSACDSRAIDEWTTWHLSLVGSVAGFAMVVDSAYERHHLVPFGSSSWAWAYHRLLNHTSIECTGSDGAAQFYSDEPNADEAYGWNFLATSAEAPLLYPPNMHFAPFGGFWTALMQMQPIDMNGRVLASDDDTMRYSADVDADSDGNGDNNWPTRGVPRNTVIGELFMRSSSQATTAFDDLESTLATCRMRMPDDLVNIYGAPFSRFADDDDAFDGVFNWKKNARKLGTAGARHEAASATVVDKFEQTVLECSRARFADLVERYHRTRADIDTMVACSQPCLTAQEVENPLLFGCDIVGQPGACELGVTTRAKSTNIHYRLDSLSFVTDWQRCVERVRNSDGWYEDVPTPEYDRRVEREIGKAMQNHGLSRDDAAQRVRAMFALSTTQHDSSSTPSPTPALPVEEIDDGANDVTKRQSPSRCKADQLRECTIDWDACMRVTGEARDAAAAAAAPDAAPPVSPCACIGAWWRCANDAKCNNVPSAQLFMRNVCTEERCVNTTTEETTTPECVEFAVDVPSDAPTPAAQVLHHCDKTIYTCEIEYGRCLSDNEQSNCQCVSDKHLCLENFRCFNSSIAAGVAADCEAQECTTELCTPDIEQPLFRDPPQRPTPSPPVADGYERVRVAFAPSTTTQTVVGEGCTRSPDDEAYAYDPCCSSEFDWIAGCPSDGQTYDVAEQSLELANCTSFDCECPATAASNFIDTVAVDRTCEIFGGSTLFVQDELTKLFSAGNRLFGNASTLARSVHWAVFLQLTGHACSADADCHALGAWASAGTCQFTGTPDESALDGRCAIPYDDFARGFVTELLAAPLQTFVRTAWRQRFGAPLAGESDVDWVLRLFTASTTCTSTYNVPAMSRHWDYLIDEHYRLSCLIENAETCQNGFAAPIPLLEPGRPQFEIGVSVTRWRRHDPDTVAELLGSTCEHPWPNFFRLSANGVDHDEPPMQPSRWESWANAYPAQPEPGFGFTPPPNVTVVCVTDHGPCFEFPPLEASQLSDVGTPREIGVCEAPDGTLEYGVSAEQCAERSMCSAQCFERSECGEADCFGHWTTCASEEACVGSGSCSDRATGGTMEAARTGLCRLDSDASGSRSCWNKYGLGFAQQFEKMVSGFDGCYTADEKNALSSASTTVERARELCRSNVTVNSKSYPGAELRTPATTEFECTQRNCIGSECWPQQSCTRPLRSNDKTWSKRQWTGVATSERQPAFDSSFELSCRWNTTTSSTSCADADRCANPDPTHYMCDCAHQLPSVFSVRLAVGGSTLTEALFAAALNDTVLTPAGLPLSGGERATTAQVDVGAQSGEACSFTPRAYNWTHPVGTLEVRRALRVLSFDGDELRFQLVEEHPRTTTEIVVDGGVGVVDVPVVWQVRAIDERATHAVQRFFGGHLSAEAALRVAQAGRTFEVRDSAAAAAWTLHSPWLGGVAEGEETFEPVMLEGRRCESAAQHSVRAHNTWKPGRWQQSRWHRLNSDFAPDVRNDVLTQKRDAFNYYALWDGLVEALDSYAAFATLGQAECRWSRAIDDMDKLVCFSFNSSDPTCFKESDSYVAPLISMHYLCEGQSLTIPIGEHEMSIDGESIDRGCGDLFCKTLYVHRSSVSAFEPAASAKAFGSFSASRSPPVPYFVQTPSTRIVGQLVGDGVIVQGVGESVLRSLTLCLRVDASIYAQVLRDRFAHADIAYVYQQIPPDTLEQLLRRPAARRRDYLHIAGVDDADAVADELEEIASTGAAGFAELAIQQREDPVRWNAIEQALTTVRDLPNKTAHGFGIAAQIDATLGTQASTTSTTTNAADGTTAPRHFCHRFADGTLDGALPPASSATTFSGVVDFFKQPRCRRSLLSRARCGDDDGACMSLAQLDQVMVAFAETQLQISGVSGDDDEQDAGAQPSDEQISSLLQSRLGATMFDLLQQSVERVPPTQTRSLSFVTTKTTDNYYYRLHPVMRAELDGDGGPAAWDDYDYTLSDDDKTMAIVMACFYAVALVAALVLLIVAWRFYPQNQNVLSKIFQLCALVTLALRFLYFLLLAVDALPIGEFHMGEAVLATLPVFFYFSAFCAMCAGLFVALSSGESTRLKYGMCGVVAAALVAMVVTFIVFAVLPASSDGDEVYICGQLVAHTQPEYRDHDIVAIVFLCFLLLLSLGVALAIIVPSAIILRELSKTDQYRADGNRVLKLKTFTLSVVAAVSFIGLDIMLIVYAAQGDERAGLDGAPALLVVELLPIMVIFVLRVIQTGPRAGKSTMPTTASGGSTPSTRPSSAATSANSTGASRSTMSSGAASSSFGSTSATA